VYIAPQPGDVLVAYRPETEVDDKPGNDRHKSAGDQCNVRVKRHSTPSTANRNRQEPSDADENEATTPANQRLRSEKNLTRAMSDGYLGRLEGRKSRSWKKSDQQASVEQSTKRRSLDEAEQLIENEVVEAMRREQELRYV